MITNRNLDSVHIKEFFSHLTQNENEIFKRKKLLIKKNILEIGCGEGNTIIDLKKKYSINAYTIDINAPEDKLKENNIKYIRHNLNQINDLLELNLKFDFIYSFRVFLHLDFETRINVLKFILEKLEKNGIAIIDYTGDFSQTRVNYEKSDDSILESILKSKSENITIRIVENVNYRVDFNLIEEIDKPLYNPEQIAFKGQILIIHKEK